MVRRKTVLLVTASLFLVFAWEGVRIAGFSDTFERYFEDNKHESDAFLEQLAAPGFPVDSEDSSHPVERAIAFGIVLDTRLTSLGLHQWERVRLVRTPIQDRLVRVVEEWEMTDPGVPFNRRRDMYLADQLILQVAEGVDETVLKEAISPAGMRVEERISNELYTVRLSKADLDAVPEGLRFFAQHRSIARFAEPDGIGFGGGTPNDTLYSTQWGLHNTGQSGGVSDADVDAPEFWDIIENAPGIVVAVLDSGLNFSHPDLQGIAWNNPGEIPGDGIDNDGSNRVDDVNGWDFVNSDNNPTDDHGHGSNVTGIIAANRNNGTGIAGMIGGVEILVCKILNANNSGFTSHLIAATTYARQRGVPIMNLSLQNYPFSSSLNSEFTACRNAGVFLAICCGNQGVNNDITPNYPSSYSQSNILSVGNHEDDDVRWSGSFNPSNYGLSSVDIFAPGRRIHSPILGSSYSYYTGTSQAAPFVAAIAAAIKYVNPSWTASEIKDSIMGSVILRPAYSGICSTGGRLNAVTAMASAFQQMPLNDRDYDGHSNFFEYLAGTRVDLDSDAPVIVTDFSGGYLKIGTSQVSRPEGSLIVEKSEDLRKWTEMGVTDFSSSDDLLGGVPRAGYSQLYLHIKAAAD
ncbi:MAG: S8 family peptidase [Verrucomicrobiota bacterium]